MQARHLHGKIEFETFSPPMFHDDVVLIGFEDAEISGNRSAVLFAIARNIRIIKIQPAIKCEGKL